MALSIRAKILIITVAVLSFSIIASTLITSYFFSREYSRVLQSEAIATARELRLQLDRLLRFRLPIEELSGFEEQCQDLVDRYEDISYAMVMSLEGEVLFHNDPSQHSKVTTDPAILNALKSGKEVIQVYPDQGVRYFDIIVPVFGIHHELTAAVRVGFPERNIVQKTKRLIVYSTVGAFIFLGFAIILVVFSTTIWVSKPITKLVNVIKKVSKKGTNFAELVEINKQLQQEILERKAAEEKIKESLKEKEILLQEIHHRVKNNMQVIISLLKLQSRRIKDNHIREVFRESQNRISAMALIHDVLYQSDSLSNINMKQYITRLLKNLSGVYGAQNRNIVFRTDIEKITLGIDQAIPCGLVLNELVSNSFEHAFSKRRNKGEIGIKVSRTEAGEIELVVSDDGKGMPEDIECRNTETLGLQLVTGLIESQLDGNYEIYNEIGTKFIIRFKIKN